MQTLLQLTSSLAGADGVSARLASRFAAAWRDARLGARIIARDLAQEPVPHLTAARFAAFAKPTAERTARERLDVAVSDVLIDELRTADVIALGLPMYNFGVPSNLKAWMDHVARAGVTFRYTQNGPQGLLANKKAYVFAARGGRYAGTSLDSQTTFVRDFLAFLGITDVEFVYAEGLAMGGEHRESALQVADARIERLAA